ncbi:unnamed protein product [Sphagnum balticum]
MDMVEDQVPITNLEEKKILEAWDINHKWCEEVENEEEILWPKGEPLTNVNGIELPGNAIGLSLQLVEFCCAFGKIVHVKQGEVEKVLREIAKGCSVRRGAQSQLVRLHVELLSIILDESNEQCNVTYSATSKNSWLEVLRKYLCKKSCIGYAESKNKISGDSQIHADVNPSSSSTSFMGSMSTSCHTMLFPKGMEGFAKALGHGVEGYSSLEIYEKLQLLILLCDDVLSTTVAREHIDFVIAEVEGSKKDQREEAFVARKEAKQKEAELLQLVEETKNSGLLLSPKQQSTHLEKLRKPSPRSCINSILKHIKFFWKVAGGRRCDAMRTEAIVWDTTLPGIISACWKLKGVDDHEVVVVQEIDQHVEGFGESEKWSVLSQEDEEALAACLAQRK